MYLLDCLLLAMITPAMMMTTQDNTNTQTMTTTTGTSHGCDVGVTGIRGKGKPIYGFLFVLELMSRF